MTYEIRRKTSPFNKTLKWQVVGIDNGIEVTSDYHRTEKLAKEAVYHSERYTERHKNDLR